MQLWCFVRFERVFDSTESQLTVYNGCAKDLVQHPMNGRNASIFAYGPTGAGKCSMKNLSTRSHNDFQCSVRVLNIIITKTWTYAIIAIFQGKRTQFWEQHKTLDWYLAALKTCSAKLILSISARRQSGAMTSSTRTWKSTRKRCAHMRVVCRCVANKL